MCRVYFFSSPETWRRSVSQRFVGFRLSPWGSNRPSKWMNYGEQRGGCACGSWQPPPDLPLFAEAKKRAYRQCGGGWCWTAGLGRSVASAFFFSFKLGVDSCGTVRAIGVARAWARSAFALQCWANCRRSVSLVRDDYGSGKLLTLLCRNGCVSFPRQRRRSFESVCDGFSLYGSGRFL